MTYATWPKRLLDLLAATLALVVLSPLMMVVAVAIFAEDRSAPLFRQQRIGHHGRLFTLLKFRSMPIGTPSKPSAAAGDVRVTRVGKILRRANIDELPQLLNVISGDMSLVGPRPALESQKELNAMRRDGGAWAVRPGLTGLAQVSAYDGMPEAEKAALDSKYASGVALLADVSIIARTVVYLAKRPPVY